MARDGISQPFKLHTASLKQSSYSAFFSSRKYVSWAVIKIQFHMYDKLSREAHGGSIKYDRGVFDFRGEMREQALTLTAVFIWQGCHSKRNLWADL